MDTAVLPVRAAVPAARTLTPAFRHPGDTLYPRLMSVTTGTCRELAIDVPAGVNLFTHLQQALADAGAESGIISFSGGVFDTIDYHTVTYAPPDAATGTPAKVYGSAIRVAGPVTLLTANLSFGLSADGAPLLHCHAAFVDAEGRTHGGHLANQHCIVAADGVRAWVSVFETGVRFRARRCTETTFSVFHPEAEGAAQ